ncbi:MAG: hypothetical protein EBQ80_00575 [Proteobacteria bacterium]|nr:hypothetical protein [Pseudomonadota bacterium]
MQRVLRPWVRWLKGSGWLPDAAWFYVRFRWERGRWPRRSSPCFSDKLLYLCLADRHPLRRVFADKLAGAAYVQRVCPTLRLPKTYGVYQRFEEIDWRKIPHRVVLKANHGSGFVQVMENHRKVDKAALAKRAAEWLATDYYGVTGGEWPYRNLPRRLVLEECLHDRVWGSPPPDVKVLVQQGVVRGFIVVSGRYREDMRKAFYDADFVRIGSVVHEGYPNNVMLELTPAAVREVKQLAVKLAADVPFVRVDFYRVNGQWVFGEFTNFSQAGSIDLAPMVGDVELGRLLN